MGCDVQLAQYRGMFGGIVWGKTFEECPGGLSGAECPRVEFPGGNVRGNVHGRMCRGQGWIVHIKLHHNGGPTTRQT